MDMNQFNDEELHQALNLQTAQISWLELQRQFASGRLIKVSSELDLIKTAMKFVRDDKDTIEKWISEEKIMTANDIDARHWNEKQADLWSVVVAPWVLAQEIPHPEENK